jgi:hypothetical protein
MIMLRCTVQMLPSGQEMLVAERWLHTAVLSSACQTPASSFGVLSVLTLDPYHEEVLLNGFTATKDQYAHFG